MQSQAHLLLIVNDVLNLYLGTNQFEQIAGIVPDHKLIGIVFELDPLGYFGKIS